MRRRRNNGAPVTFFSFQDVMLSLIGITIVITLILVLQVTDSAVAVLKRTGGAAGVRAGRCCTALAISRM